MAATCLPAFLPEGGCRVYCRCRVIMDTAYPNHTSFAFGLAASFVLVAVGSRKWAKKSYDAKEAKAALQLQQQNKKMATSQVQEVARRYYTESPSWSQLTRTETRSFMNPSELENGKDDAPSILAAEIVHKAKPFIEIDMDREEEIVIGTTVTADSFATQQLAVEIESGIEEQKSGDETSSEDEQNLEQQEKNDGKEPVKEEEIDNSSVQKEEEIKEKGLEYDCESISIVRAIQVVEEMTAEVTEVWEKRGLEESGDLFEMYGSFVASIMIMQSVYQDYGFAEYPDLIISLDRCEKKCTRKADTSAESAQVSCLREARGKLSEVLKTVGFTEPMISHTILPKSELLIIMGEMLKSSQKVRADMQVAIKNQDAFLTAAWKYMDDTNPQNLEALRGYCSEEQLKNLDHIASQKGTSGLVDTVDDMIGNHQMHILMEIMKPLTDTQHRMMQKYGIGSSGFYKSREHYKGDKEVDGMNEQLQQVVDDLRDLRESTS